MKTKEYLTEKIRQIDLDLASPIATQPCSKTHRLITRSSDGFTYCYTCSENFLQELARRSRLKVKKNRYLQLMDRLPFTDVSAPRADQLNNAMKQEA